MKLTIGGIRLRGIGACVPKQQVYFSESPETARITRSTGIKSVRRVDEFQDAESLAGEAAKHLFQQLSVEATSIDALIWISQSPRKRMPYGAARLGHELGIPSQAAVFDIASGCAGYIQGLLQASLLIQSGAASQVLVLAAEANSRIIPPDDTSLTMLFGDAGTATLLEKGKDEIGFELHHDGSGDGSLCANDEGLLTMDGMDVFQFSIQRVPELIGSMCKTYGLSIENMPLFALHQANSFIIQYIAKKLKLSETQIPFLADGYGNTGPASIPLLLCMLAEKQQLPSELLLVGFGIGLQWGGAFVRVTDTEFAPVKNI